MSEILEGVINQTDDSLIYRRTKEEDDQGLALVLMKLEEAGVTLNLDKCEFAKTTIKFLGHIL